MVYFSTDRIYLITFDPQADSNISPGVSDLSQMLCGSRLHLISYLLSGKA